eukprot:jgi/Mesvir1/27541/Mv07299-RA.1
MASDSEGSITTIAPEEKPTLANRASTDPNGYLDFPELYNIETSSLGIYVRGDAEAIICFTFGGVGEQLLFFPVVEALRRQNPLSSIDVACPAGSKKAWELNRNVRRTYAFDLGGSFLDPDEYTDFLGFMKQQYYGKGVCARPVGLGGALTLFLSSIEQRISYVRPNVSAAGSGLFLTKAIPAKTLNVLSLGTAMFDDLIKAGLNAPEVPPLEVNVPAPATQWAIDTLSDMGLRGKKFVLAHGLPSSSSAAMTMLGDAETSFPVASWSKLAAKSSLPMVFAAAKPEDADGPPALSNVVQANSPGKLAALVAASSGVVTTNTAALQLAMALGKKSVALFGSANTAVAFVPRAKKDLVYPIVAESGGVKGISMELIMEGVKAIMA